MLIGNKTTAFKKTKYGGVPEWPKGADCKSVTLVSMVRIHLPPPFYLKGFGLKWAHSSAGRAPALQAGGHRFEPYCAHHLKNNRISIY